MLFFLLLLVLVLVFLLLLLQNSLWLFWTFVLRASLVRCGIDSVDKLRFGHRLTNQMSKKKKKERKRSWEIGPLRLWQMWAVDQHQKQQKWIQTFRGTRVLGNGTTQEQTVFGRDYELTWHIWLAVHRHLHYNRSSEPRNTTYPWETTKGHLLMVL